MSSTLQKCLDDIGSIFHEYCKQISQDDYLQKDEFILLLKENAQDFLRDTCPADMTEDEYIDHLFAQADNQEKGYLTFHDFVTPLGLMAEYAHDKSHIRDAERGRVGHGHGHSH